jgi:hypothetical protein
VIVTPVDTVVDRAAVEGGMADGFVIATGAITP